MRPTSFVTLASGVFLLAFAGGAGAQGRAQAGAALPEGPGKTIVEGTCARCHGLNVITASWGNTQGGWRQLFASMVSLPDDQATLVSAYLAKNFPPRPAPQPVILAGPATVSFKEWVVPSLGSRPHDPLAASDGSIWWTGMFANVVGRLDPKSGMMKEYKLKTAMSGPHGITEDKNANIWFTANTGGYIG